MSGTKDGACRSQTGQAEYPQSGTAEVPPALFLHTPSAMPGAHEGGQVYVVSEDDEREALRGQYGVRAARKLDKGDFVGALQPPEIERKNAPAPFWIGHCETGCARFSWVGGWLGGSSSFGRNKALCVASLFTSILPFAHAPTDPA
eukprot:2091934-Rhodomonas_salina.5